MKIQVAIVEDERIIAEDIRMTVENLGFYVTGVVSTSQGALDLLAQQSVDIVLMDVHIQGDIDGIETAKRIYDDYNVPVVFLTAYADPNTVERIRQTTAYGFIVKPVSQESLQGTLELAMDRHRTDAELRERENKLAHVNKVLRAIRNVNQLIVKESDISNLLQGICENLIQGMGYRAAFILLMRPDNESILFKHAGFLRSSEYYFKMFGKSRIQDYFLKEPNMPVRLIEGQTKKGIGTDLDIEFPEDSRFVAHFELNNGNKGFMSVVVPPDYAVEPDEQNLFKELVDDVAYALNKIDLEQAHQRAEQQREESRLMLKTILDTIPAQVYWKDKHSKYLGCNVQFAQDAGLNHPNEVIGKTDFELRWTDEARHYQRLDREVIASGKPLLRYEEPQTSMNGATKHLRKNKIPLKDIHGQIVGVLGTSEDITYQKMAEKALVASETVLRNSLAALPLGMIISNSKEEIEFVNEHFLKMFGYSRNKFQKVEDWFGLMIPEADYRQEIFEKYLKMTREQTDSTVEYPFVLAEVICKNAERKWIEIRVVSTKKRTIITFFDTTVHVTIQNKLKESQKKYKTLLNSQNDAVFLHQFLDNGFAPFEEVNDIACKRYGYSQEEFRKLTAMDITLKEDVDVHAKAAHRKSLLDHGHMVFETVHIVKSGKHLPVEISSTIVMLHGIRYILAVARDISERKKTESMLRSQESRYRELFDKSPVSLWEEDFSKVKLILDKLKKRGIKHFHKYLQEHPKKLEECIAAVTIVDVNDATVSLFEADDKDEILGYLDHIFFKESNDIFLDEIIALYSGSMQFKSEIRGISLKGNILEFAIRVSIVPGYEETWGKVFVSLINITEKKKIELTLRKRDEQLAQAMKIARLGYWEFNIKDNVFIFNDYFYDIFKTSAEKVGGYTMSPEEYATRFLHPDDVFIVQEENRMVFENKDPDYSRTLEHRIIYEDGSIGYISVCFFVEIDQDGNQIRTYGVNQDITKRKQIELALRESERRMRNVLETIQLVAVSLDINGNIVFVNDYFLQLTGWEKDRVIGINWFKHFIPQEIQPNLQVDVFQKMVAEGQFPHYFENEIITKKGDRRLIAWNNTVLHDPEEKVIGTTSIGEDITEREKARADREKLIKQLEGKNAELERFAYTISHDLKSPLITIKGFLGLMIKDIQKSDQSSVDRDIESITSAVDQMEHLLKDLLELSRIGHVTKPYQKHNFGALAEQAIEMVQHQLNEKKANVILERKFVSVICDKVRLIEVLTNLLDNAVKFMGAQTEPEIQIGQKRIEGQTVFYVKDNGIGVDQKYHDRVFNLFEQLNPQQPGSGTGLAIVKRIIETHGGQIWLESEGVDKGTTFFFTLSQK